MSSVQFTTSTTGATLGPGVINGVYLYGTTAGVSKIRLWDAASTTGAGAPLVRLPVPVLGTGYVPLGGMQFGTNTLVASTAAYGGISVMYQ